MQVILEEDEYNDYKKLKDFVYEKIPFATVIRSPFGHSSFYVWTESEAVEKLSKANEDLTKTIIQMETQLRNATSRNL